MSLISVDDLSQHDIQALLSLAARYTENPNGQVLSGKLVLNLFFENSTRTLASFEIAVKRLGGTVVTLPLAQSSLKKGESLHDTATTLNAMGPDCVVVRHPESGAASQFDSLFACPVINAGDGTREHPTQGLLDLFTLWQIWGDLTGRKIVICGDVAHSRVARSSSKLFSIMGADVVICSPMGDTLESIGDHNLTVSHNFDEALRRADAVMMLRIQKERITPNSLQKSVSALEPFKLTPQRLILAKPEALVLHPGPMNREVEISSAVADSPNSVILNQVKNGVPVRQAVLTYFL